MNHGINDDDESAALPPVTEYKWPPQIESFTEVEAESAGRYVSPEYIWYQCSSSVRGLAARQ